MEEMSQTYSMARVRGCCAWSSGHLKCSAIVLKLKGCDMYSAFQQCAFHPHIATEMGSNYT